MRGAGITSLGGPVEVLELPGPRPLAGDEVLVEVVAAGIGNWDDIVRTGGWDVGTAPPMALGVQGAGRIVRAGKEVTGFGVGDEVLTHPLPLRQQGTWAERLIAPAGLLAPKPASVPWEVAGAFPVPALTADQVLDRLSWQAAEGRTLLVHGAGGVTGSMVVMLAAHRGLRVLSTAGPSSRERVRAAGAQDVFDYHDTAWPQEVRSRTGGAAAAVNVVRGGAAQAMRAVTDGGHLVTITSDPPAPERGITVSDLYVRPDGERLTALAALLASGSLTVAVGAAYPLEQAATGLARAVSGSTGGSGVLLP